MRERGGNCVLGAVWLAWHCRVAGVRLLWRGRVVPHVVVRLDDGTWWHFGLVRDVLPWPLCYLWFRGRIRRYLAPRD